MKTSLVTFLATFISLFLGLDAHSANCPEFATTLEAMLGRVTSRQEVRALKEKWNGESATAYKAKYNRELTDQGNRDFIKNMESDSGGVKKNTLYFDVENSIQKKLNDSIVGDKMMVDSINNSFMDKFYKSVNEDPILKEKISSQYYKDYKSLRLRLEVKPGESAKDMQQRLNAAYKKANEQFVSEFESEGLTKLIPPRTDEVPDVSTWFLSGMGDSALEANMAARGARAMGFNSGNAQTMNFKALVENLHKDVVNVERLRSNLTKDSELLAAGIMQKLGDGKVIPSKEMIGVLRKIKLSDCDSKAQYLEKMRTKVSELFGTKLSDQHIEDFTEYFKLVDSISPPLFQRARVNMNLSEAQNGLVSVDFTGVGVENAHAQMRALAGAPLNVANKEAALKTTFSALQKNVDEVTESMNTAKRAFSDASFRKSEADNSPLFSGDDGMLMPKSEWSMSEKIDLVKKLSQAEDPSKFRVTFVKTEFKKGSKLPVSERSQRVVRAESIEKDLREALTGIHKIPSERAKKLIFAVDSTPAVKGGEYNLIIGGAKVSDSEKKLILEAFSSMMKKEEGEKLGKIIEAIN